MYLFARCGCAFAFFGKSIHWIDFLSSKPRVERGVGDKVSSTACGGCAETEGREGGANVVENEIAPFVLSLCASPPPPQAVEDDTEHVVFTSNVHQKNAVFAD